MNRRFLAVVAVCVIPLAGCSRFGQGSMVTAFTPDPFMQIDGPQSAQGADGGGFVRLGDTGPAGDVATPVVQYHQHSSPAVGQPLEPQAPAQQFAADQFTAQQYAQLQPGSPASGPSASAPAPVGNPQMYAADALNPSTSLSPAARAEQEVAAMLQDPRFRTADYRRVAGAAPATPPVSTAIDSRVQTAEFEDVDPFEDVSGPAPGSPTMPANAAVRGEADVAITAEADAMWELLDVHSTTQTSGPPQTGWEQDPVPVPVPQLTQPPVSNVQSPASSVQPVEIPLTPSKPSTATQGGTGPTGATTPTTTPTTTAAQPANRQIVIPTSHGETKWQATRRR